MPLLRATCLMQAAVGPPSSADALSVLLSARADLHARGNGGWGPMEFLAFKQDSDPDACQLLIKSGYPLNQRTKPRKAMWRSAFSIYRTLHRAGRRTPLSEFVALASGSTPLHIAYASGHVELISLLIQAGSDENIRNDMGKRPQDLTGRSTDY